MQTPWLTAFLHDPHMIRPAAQLRMPRFHFGKDEKASSKETDTLANYFAAHDGATFPYQSIPEQNPELPGRAKYGSSRLPGGRLDHDDQQGIAVPAMSRDRPVQARRRRGRRQRAGPARVASRFRPEFLEAWLANPRRLLPFTAMPQNIAPHGEIQIQVPKTFENKPIDMVRAIRDTLLNYVNAVELQLASAAPGGPAATPAGTPPKAAGNAP